jgi:hypothetical protein
MEAVEYPLIPSQDPMRSISYRLRTLRQLIFDPRRRSLIRANALVLLSLGASLYLSDFPNNRPTLLLILPAIFAAAGTADTIRCMQRSWNFYHAGVILCVYMDLMVLGMIFFFLLYPYLNWLSLSH